MSRYRITLRSYWNGNPEVKRWFNSLTSEQIQELGALDYNSNAPGGIAQKPIAEDWIEEHGGLREWWNAINTEVVG